MFWSVIAKIGNVSCVRLFLLRFRGYRKQDRGLNFGTIVDGILAETSGSHRFFYPPVGSQQQVPMFVCCFKVLCFLLEMSPNRSHHSVC